MSIHSQDTIAVDDTLEETPERTKEKTLKESLLQVYSHRKETAVKPLLLFGSSSMNLQDIETASSLPGEFSSLC